jgi:predicted AlkP superfamily phosphohydrolase/phosphomutase
VADGKGFQFISQNLPGYVEQGKEKMTAMSCRRILLANCILSCLLLVTGCSRTQAPAESRVVVIGFDGLTFDTLTPWCDQGYLPNFTTLLNNGYSSVLTSVEPPSSPPAWTTAVTGVNPGKHGIYGFLQHSKYASEGSGEPDYISSTDRLASPLWKILEKEQKRVCLINIPITSPPDSVNGMMIAGFPHDSSSPLTFPRSIKKDIPEYRIDLFGLQPHYGEEEVWLSNLYDRALKRADVALRYLKSEPWDLFWIVFTGTDRIQHFFWKYYDHAHPLHTSVDSGKYKNAIRDFYIFMDAQLGRLIDAIPEDINLIVMSDHGFGPVYRGINANALVNESALIDESTGDPP